MKKWFALLICAIVLLPSCTALAVEVDGDVLLLGGGARVGYCKHLPLKDGTMIVSLGTRAPLGSQENYPNSAIKTQLMRIGAKGEILWYVELGEETGTTLFTTMHVKADGVLMGMLSHSANQYSLYDRWQKYSMETGELLWQGEKQDTSNPDIDITNYVGGGSAVTMEHRYIGNDETSRRIWLVGDDGNPVWTMKPEDGVNYLYDACGVDGATLLYGRYSDKQKHADAMYTALMLIQNDGSTVWSRVYEDFPIGQHCKIIEANEQTATLITRKTYFSEGGSTLFTIDMKTGDVRNSVEVEGFNDVLKTPQGLLMLCISENEQYHLTLIDEQGNELSRWDAPKRCDDMIVPTLLSWNGQYWIEGMMNDDLQTNEMHPINIP